MANAEILGGRNRGTDLDQVITFSFTVIFILIETYTIFDSRN